MSMDADLNAWLDAVLPRALPGFLPAQRWFGGKARSIQTADIQDAVWFGETERPCALVVVGVQYADGTQERYAMVLALVGEQAALPVVARVEQGGRRLWAVEAATDADAALALVGGFVSPSERPTRRGGCLRFEDCDDVAAHALARVRVNRVVRPVGTEQSNTSVRLDGTLVFKLFRKLDDGENPELEMGRFLTTKTTFRAMPMLRGALTYVSARGRSSTVGVLQDWMENRGDGWSHVVGLLRQSTAQSVRESLLRDLYQLGATTADFHTALATGAGNPAFAPEPVTASDLEGWQASLVAQASSTLLLVERCLSAFPEEARRLGTMLLDLSGRGTGLPRLPGMSAATALQKIRVHGDYHLGQTLRTPDGFALIDFEGAPARPIAERRLKQCALKDVAGMIRSFDYAAETAWKEAPQLPREALPVPLLRSAFLEGYLSSAAAPDAVFLPKGRPAIDAWIAFFEAEKALYEVEYEINNRPAWVHIPLRGMVDILHGHV